MSALVITEKDHVNDFLPFDVVVSRRNGEFSSNQCVFQRVGLVVPLISSCYVLTIHKYRVWSRRTEERRWMWSRALEKTPKNHSTKRRNLSWRVCIVDDNNIILYIVCVLIRKCLRNPRVVCGTSRRLMCFISRPETTCPVILLYRVVEFRVAESSEFGSFGKPSKSPRTSRPSSPQIEMTTLFLSY